MTLLAAGDRRQELRQVLAHGHGGRAAVEGQRCVQPGGVAAGQSTFAVILLAEGGTSGETTLRALRSGV